MKIFQNRKQLFDIEKFKRRQGGMPIDVDKQEIKDCFSIKVQDYKFRKLGQKYNLNKMKSTFLPPQVQLNEKKQLPNLHKYQTIIKQELNKNNQPQSLGPQDSNYEFYRKNRSFSTNSFDQGETFGKQISRHKESMIDLISEQYGRDYVEKMRQKEESRRLRESIMQSQIKKTKKMKYEASMKSLPKSRKPHSEYSEKPRQILKI